MLTTEQLGLRIKQIRKNKKITQEKLAELIDVDCGYISKLEVGQNYPSINTLNKIADVLNVDISEFFQHTELNKIHLKEKIIELLDNFTKEEQIIVYKVAKSLK